MVGVDLRGAAADAFAVGVERQAVFGVHRQVLVHAVSHHDICPHPLSVHRRHREGILQVALVEVDAGIVAVDVEV